MRIRCCRLYYERSGGCEFSLQKGRRDLCRSVPWPGQFFLSSFLPDLVDDWQDELTRDLCNDSVYAHMTTISMYPSNIAQCYSTMASH